MKLPIRHISARKLSFFFRLVPAKTPVLPIETIEERVSIRSIAINRCEPTLMTVQEAGKGATTRQHAHNYPITAFALAAVAV